MARIHPDAIVCLPVVGSKEELEEFARLCRGRFAVGTRSPPVFLVRERAGHPPASRVTVAIHQFIDQILHRAQLRAWGREVEFVCDVDVMLEAGKKVGLGSQSEEARAVAVIDVSIDRKQAAEDFPGARVKVGRVCRRRIDDESRE